MWGIPQSSRVIVTFWASRVQRATSALVACAEADELANAPASAAAKVERSLIELLVIIEV
jgi:hypothetical protein